MDLKRVTTGNLKTSKSITHTRFTLCHKTFISSFQTVLMITDIVTIHSVWKEQFENVCVCVCVCTTSQIVCHVTLKNNSMFSNKFN